MTDKFGKEVKAGSRIIVSNSYNGKLSPATVTEVREVSKTGYIYDNASQKRIPGEVRKMTVYYKYDGAETSAWTSYSHTRGKERFFVVES